MDVQSTQVTDAGEMTRLRRNSEAVRSSDIVDWLLGQRDIQAAIEAEAFQRSDFGTIGLANELKDRYFTAAVEIRRLREQNAALREVLTSRVLVEFKAAKDRASFAGGR